MSDQSYLCAAQLVYPAREVVFVEGEKEVSVSRIRISSDGLILAMGCGRDPEKSVVCSLPAQGMVVRASEDRSLVCEAPEILGHRWAGFCEASVDLQTGDILFSDTGGFVGFVETVDDFGQVRMWTGPLDLAEEVVDYPKWRESLHNYAIELARAVIQDPAALHTGSIEGILQAEPSLAKWDPFLLEHITLIKDPYDVPRAFWVAIEKEPVSDIVSISTSQLTCAALIGRVDLPRAMRLLDGLSSRYVAQSGLLKADIYLKHGDMSSAEPYVKDLKGQEAKLSLWSLNVCASVYHALGKTDLARHFLRQFSVSGSSPTMMETALSTAWKWKDPELALEIGNLEISRFPKLDHAPTVAGRIYEETGDFKTAKDVYSDILRRYPSNGPALEGLVRIASHEKNLPEAVELAKKWISLEETAKPWWSSGRILNENFGAETAWNFAKNIPERHLQNSLVCVSVCQWKVDAGDFSDSQIWIDRLRELIFSGGQRVDPKSMSQSRWNLAIRLALASNSWETAYKCANSLLGEEPESVFALESLLEAARHVNGIDAKELEIVESKLKELKERPPVSK